DAEGERAFVRVVVGDRNEAVAPAGGGGGELDGERRAVAGDEGRLVRLGREDEARGERDRAQSQIGVAEVEDAEGARGPGRADLAVAEVDGRVAVVDRTRGV